MVVVVYVVNGNEDEDDDDDDQEEEEEDARRETYTQRKGRRHNNEDRKWQPCLDGYSGAAAAFPLGRACATTTERWHHRRSVVGQSLMRSFNYLPSRTLSAAQAASCNAT